MSRGSEQKEPGIELEFCPDLGIQPGTSGAAGVALKCDPLLTAVPLTVTVVT